MWALIELCERNGDFARKKRMKKEYVSDGINSNEMLSVLVLVELWTKLVWKISFSRSAVSSKHGVEFEITQWRCRRRRRRRRLVRRVPDDTMCQCMRMNEWWRKKVIFVVFAFSTAIRFRFDWKKYLLLNDDVVRNN